MKSTHHSGIVRSSGRSGLYHGRYTLERIYRRIAASNVVDTLRRGRSRRTEVIHFVLALQQRLLLSPND